MLKEKEFERLISSLDSLLTTLRSSVKFVKETLLSRVKKTNFPFFVPQFRTVEEVLLEFIGTIRDGILSFRHETHLC